MKARDVVIGFVVLVVLVAGGLYIKNARKAKISPPTPTPSFQEVENKFPGLKVPENADRINLNSVAGEVGMGEAARTFENGKFSLTVMADLPAPKVGFYQGWIVKDGAYFSLGKMVSSKGGYIVEFSSVKDYSDYKKVVVTEEKVFDSTPETHILEGSY